MFRGRFEVTDGTNTVDLLGNNGGPFCVNEWIPTYPTIKDDGIWLNNPLVDGRQLAIRKQNNIIENITLTVKGQSQTDIYSAIRKLSRLLDKATKYWTDRQNFSTPVYLIIQYPEETVATQALIYDFRLPRLADPFNPPMFAGNPPYIQEFLLTIERGYRIPISGICADLDYSYSVQGGVLTDDFLITQSEDDASINLTTQAFSVSDIYGTIGVVSGVNSRGVAIRFRNVTIPAGTTIFSARIKCSGVEFTQASSNADLLIEGEADIAPAIFSTWANYITRPRTTAKAYIDGVDYDTPWGIGATVYIPRISNSSVGAIIQEIIGLPGWASGNDLVLFVLNNDPGPGGTGSWAKLMASFDNPTYDPPELEVTYGDEKDISIVDSSCAGVVMSNQEKFNDIGDVLVYDASGGTYTNLKGTALPWTLFPAVPAVGDILYLACNFNTTTSDALPFAHFLFNLSTAMVNATLVFEYWNGGAWTALGDKVDKTSSLTYLGQHSVHFSPNSAWAANAVNGITAYWVRIRISASAGAITPPVQAAPNEIMLSSRPFVDITTIPDSDFACKLRVKVTPNGSNAPAWPGAGISAYSIDEVYIASRTINRGADFTPFLNLATYTGSRPNGVTFTGAGGANTALITAPTGYAYRYNPAGVVAETNRITLAFAAPAVSQYKGKFRVFLRRYGVTTPENLTYRLKLATSTGGSTPAYFQTSQIVDYDDTDYTLVDFGVVDFTPQVGNYENLYLIISVQATGAADVYWSDVILLPVDEMFVHAYQRIGADVTYYLNGYDDISNVVDGVSGDELSAYVERSGEIINPFLFESNSLFELDVASDDIRLWFLVGRYAASANYIRVYKPITGYSVTVEIQPKYI